MNEAIPILLIAALLVLNALTNWRIDLLWKAVAIIRADQKGGGDA